MLGDWDVLRLVVGVSTLSGISKNRKGKWDNSETVLTFKLDKGCGVRVNWEKEGHHLPNSFVASFRDCRIEAYRELARQGG
jgi:hypothetical protein